MSSDKGHWSDDWTDAQILGMLGFTILACLATAVLLFLTGNIVLAGALLGTAAVLVVVTYKRI